MTTRGTDPLSIGGDGGDGDDGDGDVDVDDGCGDGDDFALGNPLSIKIFVKGLTTLIC